MKNIEKILIIIGLLMTAIFFLVDQNIKTAKISLVIIFFIFLLLLFLQIKQQSILEEIITQGWDIVKRGSNRKILIRSQGILAEIIILLNKILDLYQQEVIKSKLAEESRERLLTNISHDIRTPLTSILGYIEALRDDLAVNKEERDYYFKILINKSKGLKKLVDEIFQLSRLDADESDLNFCINDLAEIIRECLIEFLPVIKKEGFQLQVDIPDGEFPFYSDRLSLERVINNVIQNSLTYGKEGGFLGVKLINSGQKYVLQIQDKGQGIELEDIPYIFDRLYISEKSRKRSFSGTGLGLAIARKLLEKHQGRIEVESIPFEKTTFTLTFPSIH